MRVRWLVGAEPCLEGNTFAIGRGTDLMLDEQIAWCHVAVSVVPNVLSTRQFAGAVPIGPARHLGDDGRVSGAVGALITHFIDNDGGFA